MTTDELREVMYRNGDAPSYPYWSVQTLLWNGEPVTVREPSHSYPMHPNEMTPDGS